MINKIEAEAIAKNYLLEVTNEFKSLDGMEIPLEITGCDEYNFGWLFFYESTQYMKTLNVSYALAGNAPFIVQKDNGKIFVLGTAHSVEKYLKDYENQSKS